MINGASELLPSNRENFITPSFKVTMYGGDILGITTIPGVTTTFSGGIKNALYFNGRYIVAINQRVFSFLPDFTGTTFADIFATENNIDLFNTGDTAILNYGFGLSIIRLYSVDGQSWGGTEVLGGVGVAYTIASTDVNRMYISKEPGLAPVTSVNESGGTWGQTVIYAPYPSFHRSSAVVIRHDVSAMSIDADSDIVLLNTSKQDQSNISHYTGGILALKTDGIIPYGYRNIIPIENPSSEIYMSQVYKGASRYYLGLIRTEVETSAKIDETGASIPTEDQYMTSIGYIESIDGFNWSNMRVVGTTNNTGLTYAYKPPSIAIAPGASDNEKLRLVYTTTGRISDNTGKVATIYQDTTGVDITDNIISIRNTNNLRVNLTIGNYE